MLVAGKRLATLLTWWLPQVGHSLELALAEAEAVLPVDRDWSAESTC